MSNIRDRGVIDMTLIEDGRYVLIILDDIRWEFATRQEHARMLQNKLNDYLDYVSSGQAEEAKPGLRPVIRVLSRYPYSRYCISFLERVSTYVKGHGDICDIEWTHSPEDGPFEDGFSDDFIFDAGKIYPRIKKNWAKDPLSEVSLMPPYSSSPDYPQNLVMLRVKDSFVGMFVQDMGSVLTYITYDMLPEGTDVAKLGDTAFDNLARDIRYRTSESKIPGIYGILAGGDFEAESLCIDSIWQQISEDLNDDIMICIPTKDLVFYTKASDRRLVRKMLKNAADMFESNRKESPGLLFCKDVFLYRRKKGTIEVDKRLTY